MANDDNPQVPAVIVPEVLPINAELNMDDVLSVAVTQAEDRIATEIEEAVAEAEAARKEAAEFGQEAQKLLQEEAETRSKKMKAAFDAFIKETDVNPEKLSVNVQALGPFCSEEHAHGECHRKETDQADPYAVSVVQLSIDGIGGRGYGVQVAKCFKTPAKVKTQLKKRDAANEKAEAANSRAYEWKQREANIPSYERRCRAKLAAMRLEETKKGKEVLAKLTGNLAQEVLKIPCRR